MPHFHLIVTNMQGTSPTEFEFPTLEELTYPLTGLINSFYDETLSEPDVYAKINFLMAIQDIAVVTGPVTFVVNKCREECKVDLSGRN